MTVSEKTKRALAAALKALMQEKSFDKISIGEICERCGMNRKSFYYHFEDKYDLVNWIFDTEFAEMAEKKSYKDSWEVLQDISRFLYEDRSFYRKALQIKGQNSFSDHFRELLLPAISGWLGDILKNERIEEFQSLFFADAFIMAFQRWIIEYATMPPEEFLRQLKLCMKCLAVSMGSMEE